MIVVFLVLVHHAGEVFQCAMLVLLLKITAVSLRYSIEKLANRDDNVSYYLKFPS